MSKSLQEFLTYPGRFSEINNVERKKYLQKLEIVKHLFLNGDISTAEICNKFSISLPTSKSLLNQMVKEGIIYKKGRGRSEGGRKPDLYGLKKNSLFFLSINIERFKIRFAIIDNDNSILFEKILFNTITQDSNIVELLYEWISKEINSSEFHLSQIIGVAIAMPGLVSTKEGKNFTYYLSEQEPEPLRNKFEKKFQKPVVILGDSESACLAEFHFGRARKKRNVLVIHTVWGIGLGIIMGGEIQSGESGFAGEFGHIPMAEDGLLCHCGKRGCLETEASGYALVRKTKKGLLEGQTSILNELTKEQLEELQPEMVINAANRGDQFAIDILSQIGSKLGKGIATLIQIFNPEMIVLEGKLAEAKQFITTPIQQSLNIYCMMQLKDRTKIELSNLGNNSSLYGGTIAIMDKIFKNQTGLLNSYA